MNAASDSGDIRRRAVGRFKRKRLYIKLLPGWSQLRRTRTTGVPIVTAAMIVVVPIYQSLSVLAEQILLREVPTPTNLLFLYLAALVFTVANTIFDLRTPRIVREYPSRHAFVSACVSDEILKIQYLSENRRISTEYANKIAKQVNLTAEQKRDAVKIQIERMLQTENADFGITDLESHWNSKNQTGRDSKRCMRTWISCLYVIGFVIIAVLTFVDAPLRVARSAF